MNIDITKPKFELTAEEDAELLEAERQHFEELERLKNDKTNDTDNSSNRV